MTRSLVYLGPEGTFTHQAALALVPRGVEIYPRGDLETVLKDLREGQAEFGVAALDSAAGPIALTQAALDEGWATALATHDITVSFDLYRHPEDTRTLVGLYGHEKALAQVSDFIATHRIETRSVASNTAGLVAVRERARAGWGAAGPPGLAERYGLEVKAKALEGQSPHTTRFALLVRRPESPELTTPRTAHD